MKSKSKKLIAILLSIIIIIVGGGTYLYFRFYRTPAKETVKLSEITDADDITLTAHRGLSALAPENTIPAIELAGKNGYKYAEFDIHLTEDGVWILNHEEHLIRMTGKLGYIKDYTYFELAEYNINNGANHKEYPNLKMPSLDDALDACLKHNIIPMIEIKDYTDSGIESLVNSITEHGFEESCYVISFKYDAIEAVEKINANIDILYLVEKLDEEHLKQCLDNPHRGVSFKADPKVNTSEEINQLKEKGIELFTWTVDEKDTIDYYYPLGVKNFVTNRILP
ncbi:MAG: hypothetical protein IJZ88_02055 [Clostridia bacterium]|nr:hypothetical protein [Clostridia bacterium]